MIRAYLDNNATTRPAPSVVVAMREYLEHLYLNPSSSAGQRIQGHSDPVRSAKRGLAALLGSEDLADGVLLTSGASEANSWALFTAMGGRTGAHLVISAIEHPSLRRSAEAAAAVGHPVTYVPVDAQGRVDEAVFQSSLRPDTSFVSVMLANNETGVIQPVERLARHVRDVCPEAMIHCDATPALGRVEVDLQGPLAEVDLLSLSGHKFHGPKGIGALYVRPGLRVLPMIHGEQDEGLRGGTSNTPGAAGIAEAARLVRADADAMNRMRRLRDDLEERLLRLVPSARVNGAAADRLPNTSSIVFPGLNADEAVDRLAMAGICIATGSACSAGANAPSPVLLAMGLSYADALSTLRFSLSAESTREEVDIAVDALSHTLCMTA